MSSICVEYYPVGIGDDHMTGGRSIASSKSAGLMARPLIFLRWKPGAITAEGKAPEQRAGRAVVIVELPVERRLVGPHRLNACLQPKPAQLSSQQRPVNWVEFSEGDDVGVMLLYLPEAAVQTAEDNPISDAELGHEPDPLALRQVVAGPESPTRPVARDDHDEKIAERTGLAQVVDMPCVEAVECPESHDNYFIAHTLPV